MKLTADDVQSLVIPGSGHYCLEEAPEEMLAAFLAPYRDRAARGAQLNPSRDCQIAATPATPHALTSRRA